MRASAHTTVVFGQMSKKLRERKILHKFFIISGIIRVAVDENGHFKIVTQMADLLGWFPAIVIPNLYTT